MNFASLNILKDAKPMEFINNLPYLAEGMIGIAIVMGIIIGSIVLLNKLFKKD